MFSQVDILFSIGGKYYTGEPITYTYMEDKIFETSRNITIKLHHRVGKFVKLRLHFSDRWIMVSEVTFDSGKTINRIAYLYFIKTVDLYFYKLVININNINRAKKNIFHGNAIFFYKIKNFSI